MARSSRNRKRKSTKPGGGAPSGQSPQKPAPPVEDSPKEPTVAPQPTNSDASVDDSAAVEKSAAELIERLQKQIAELTESQVAEAEAVANRNTQAAEQLDASSDLLSQTLAEIKKTHAAIADERQSLDALKNELATRDSQLSGAEGELQGLREALDAEATKLEQERERVADKAAKTSAQRRLIARQLRDQRTTQSSQPDPSVDSARESELRCELEMSSEKIELLEHELSRVREINNDIDSADRDAMNDIREELDAAVEEAQELRLQNQDLAAQLATTQVSDAGFSGHVASESMTWEQRKESMLRQLDAEDADCTSDQEDTRRIEIEDILERTDREIARRDEEIAELRRLLAEQSGAMGDVAVGGAAVLQMLDQDELIAEERAKLQRIQKEWEEKLRQAEIDVSLERARLARERIELEQQLAELRHVEKVEEEGETKGRRWLARLGLAEDE